MQPYRIFQSAIILMLLMSSLAGNAGGLDGLSRYMGIETPPDARKTDYKVGDRLPQHSPAGKSPYKLAQWDDLVPKDWDPMKDFKKLDFNKMKDSDPRAIEALQKLREIWDNAPVAPAMDGARIRIPGFIVPLEMARNQIFEFLLVPYYGACIHVPPPPANQIIHVFPAKPLKKEIQSMDAVWVSGVLETLPSTTDMGSASYRMKADIVIPYKQ